MGGAHNSQSEFELSLGVERLTVSSSDRDSSTVKATADETVSSMNDPTNEERGITRLTVSGVALKVMISNCKSVIFIVAGCYLLVYCCCLVYLYYLLECGHWCRVQAISPSRCYQPPP